MSGKTYARLIFFLAGLCCSGTWAHVSARDLPYQFHPGLRISQTKPLTTRELTGLMRELSSLSGLHLTVDVDGTIRYDSKSPSVGGSATARELLVKAIENDDSFSVESANQSTQVAFAQIESTMTYREGTNPFRNVWIIRIDFADFTQLRGDATAIKAFNPGLNLMHELTHAILRLPDPNDPSDRLGPCERHLNQMRAELGMPLRQYYFAKTRWARIPTSPSQILQAELSFTHPQSESLLTFDIAMVVDTQRAKSKSSIPSDLLALVSKR